MKPSLVVSTTLSLLAGFIVACASQPQPVSEPTRVSATQPKPEATPQPSAEAPDAASAAPASAPEPVAEPEPAPQPAPEPTLNPVEVLTGRETAFVIDFANSGAKETIEKRCAARASDDPDEAEKLRKSSDDCRKKERSQFTADVLRFRRDDSGNGTMTIYRRTGSALPEVYVAKVRYEQLGKNGVKVIVKAGMSGARPICRDRQHLEITVPNGYSIELADSVYGRLPYDAKVGLVAN